jgi:hypothetical protein
LNCFDYFNFFIFIGIIEKKENILLGLNDEKLEKINNQALSILFTFIVTIKSLNYSEIQISCAVIKLIREINNFENLWINLYKEFFYLEEEDFQECYEAIKL